MNNLLTITGVEDSTSRTDSTHPRTTKVTSRLLATTEKFQS